MKKIRRRVRRMTPAMLVEKYSDSEILEATADNFPALKNFWDKNHVSGLVATDTVGTQDITSLDDEWGLDERGFHKFDTGSTQQPPGDYEAPGDRDFMLLGCAYIALHLRLVTIGGNGLFSDPNAPGLSFNPSYPDANYSAFLDPSNYASNNALSFAGDISSSNPVTGCYAVVVSPSAGTVSTHWAGRNSSGATYEVSTDTDAATAAGSIQTTWPALGTGWTMDPLNRLEWVGLMMFESGAPNDIQEGMEWMAQYDDVRLYPGWKGKQ